MPGRLELSAWEPCVGETFVVEVEGRGPVEVELVEAAPSPWQPSAHSDLPQAFHLVFRSSPDVLLGQQTYRISHPRLGDLEIFVTPIGQSAAGTDYQAVFS